MEAKNPKRIYKDCDYAHTECFYNVTTNGYKRTIGR